MKNNPTIFTLLILALLIVSDTTAQQLFKPLPDSNASWIIECDDGYGGTYFERFILSPNLDDTVINSINYTKIYKQSWDSDTLYFGAFRNAGNGKSYFIKRSSDTEHLLRDFSKIAGDTIYNVDFEDGADSQWILDFIVDSTDFVESGPYTCKIMYLSTVVEDTIPEQGPEPMVWIEKIGCFAGGIVNSLRGGLGAIKFYCMQYNDTVYYNNPGAWWFKKEQITYQNGQCDYPVGIETASSADGIILSPNPFSNLLSVNNISEYNEIEIIIENILGQVEYYKKFNDILQSGITINTSRFSSGVYILKIFSNNRLLLTRKVVKK